MDHFIEIYKDKNYKYPTMVSQQGRLLAFAMDDQRQIYYSVLDLEKDASVQGQQGTDSTDKKFWTTPRPLKFVTELVQDGYGLIDPVSMKSGTTAKLSADAPFQVLADGQDLYLFRQAISGNHPDMEYVKGAINLRPVDIPTSVNKPIGAMVFDGKDDHVVLPSTKIDFSGGFTVEAWVRYDSFNYWSRIIDIGNPGAVESIFLANFQSSSTLILRNHGRGEVSANVLELGKWMHLAATIDTNGKAKLFKNGIVVQTGAVPLPANIQRANNYLGKSNWPDKHFDGQMTEVRLWNRERSEAELKAAMNSRLSGTEAGLVGYWKFNEEKDSKIQDSSPSKLDGTLRVGGSDKVSNKWTHTDDMPLDGQEPTSDLPLRHSTQIGDVPVVNRTLLVDRFALVGQDLLPKLDVRYQRSRNKYRPESEKDTLGSTDLQGHDFLEPTRELSFVRNLHQGKFNVLLLPTNIADTSRWQIFAHNHRTERVDSFNIERAEDGLFNTKGTLYYTCPHEEHQPSKELGVYSLGPGVCPHDEKHVLIPYFSRRDHAEWSLKLNAAEYVEIPNHSALQLDRDLTVSIWAKNNSAKWKKNSTLINKADSYSLKINNKGKLAFRVKVKGWKEVVATKVPDADTWRHYAGSFDGKTLSLYVDGFQVASKTLAASANLVTSTQPLQIGKGLQGQLDELRIWSYARPRQLLFMEGRHRLVGNEPGLVGYWRFDAGSGKAIYDQTDHANDGALISSNVKQKWLRSDAPIGDHPGIRRSSFSFEGFTGVKHGLDAVLYYQQELAPSGYQDLLRPQKRGARVMLVAGLSQTPAVGIDQPDPDESVCLGVLDFDVSREGKLALMPDNTIFPAVTKTVSSRVSYDIGTITIDAGWTARGTLITNGKAGQLGAADIVDWSIDLRTSGSGAIAKTLTAQNSALEIKGSFQVTSTGNTLSLAPQPHTAFNIATADRKHIFSYEAWDKHAQIYINIDPDHKYSQVMMLTDLPHYPPFPKVSSQDINSGNQPYENLPLSLLHIDTLGLTVSGGILPFTTSRDEPLLLDSANGNLVLYHRDGGNKLAASYFNTEITRAVHALAADEHDVFLQTRYVGMALGEATITVTNGSKADHCNVTVEFGGPGIRETWSNIPRNVESFADVLNGLSSAEKPGSFESTGGSASRHLAPHELERGSLSFFIDSSRARGKVKNGQSRLLMDRKLPSWVPQKPGEALRFDGNDYVTVGPDAGTIQLGKPLRLQAAAANNSFLQCSTNGQVWFGPDLFQDQEDIFILEGTSLDRVKIKCNNGMYLFQSHTDGGRIYADSNPTADSCYFSVEMLASSGQQGGGYIAMKALKFGPGYIKLYPESGGAFKLRSDGTSTADAASQILVIPSGGGQTQNEPIEELAGFDVLGGELTLEAWVHPRGGIGHAVLVDHQSNRSRYRLGIHRSQSASQAEWLFYAGMGSTFRQTAVNTSTLRQDHRWTHVAAVFKSGATPQIYLDGTLVPDIAMPEPARTRYQFTLGATRLAAGAAAEPFMGDLDEVRIWKKARTAEQIQDNLHRRLIGEKKDLVAYYPMTSRHPDWVDDHGLGGHHLTLSDDPDRANYAITTAPIGGDSPALKGAPGGQETDFQYVLQSRPGAAEYTDLQADADGLLFGVMKRGHTVVDKGQWHLITGFKVGNLKTEWSGQAHSSPQIVGFIEGPPPVPSENLTEGPASTLSNYAARSSVEFLEADKVKYIVSSSKSLSNQAVQELMHQAGAHVSFKHEQKEPTTETSLWSAQLEFNFLAGLFKTVRETSDGVLNESSFTSGRNKKTGQKMSLTGHWEDPKNLLNPQLGRRYVPENYGLAVVKVNAVDIYALRLAENNVLVNFRLVHNPDIDQNLDIIPFPINPHYTKQGTLDGKVGYQEDGSAVLDPDYQIGTHYGERSYFKPREAYLEHKKIKQKEAGRAVDYEQHLSDLTRFLDETAPKAEGVDQLISAIDSIKSKIEGLPFPVNAAAALVDSVRSTLTLLDQHSGGQAPTIKGLSNTRETYHKVRENLRNVIDRLAKRDIVDTYTWTHNGGLLTETTEVVEIKTEKVSGTYSSKENTGKVTEYDLSSSGSVGPVPVPGIAFKANHEILDGVHQDLVKMKTSELESSFRLDVQLKTEGDLQRYANTAEKEKKYKKARYTVGPRGRVYDRKGQPILEPGKVDAYRFMSFYLEPDQAHLGTLFDRVVDPIWLAESGDYRAAALRQVRDQLRLNGNPTACWRIFHRVTFVSRILPQINTPKLAPLAKALRAKNIESNWALIKALEPFVIDKTHDFVLFADAVRSTVDRYLPELSQHKEEILIYASEYFMVFDQA